LLKVEISAFILDYTGGLIVINLYQLQSFVTVVSEGSMTAAADKLYLTQPAVSQQIRSLEEGLGVELLVRGVRHIKPTSQGELLFEQAKKILQMVQQTEASVTMMNAKLSGHLRVGCLNSIGLHLMTGVLGKLLKHNPDIQMRLEYGRVDDLIKLYKKNQIDVLIAPHLEKEFSISLEDIQGRFLQKEDFWLVASGKEQGVPREIRLSELGKHPHILFQGEYQAFHENLNKKIKAAGVDLKVVFESSNVGTLKRVVETGLGWGFLPSHSIRKQVKLGRLQRIHVEDFSYQVDLLFYAQPNEEKQALFDYFYNALLAQDRI
jgi:DNA-binding transcriptional LysR family regulator